MKSNYKRIGDFIRPIKVKNIDSSDKSLLGININKYFMPSVANVVGTDLSRYKIVKKGQFSCNRMHVGRDKRLPVALSNQEDDFIVSPAYDVFEIFDKNILLPEYLMMWFSRKEFDRNAWFYTDADVRGGLHWDAFCNMQLPVPDIEKQKAIVKEYNTIVNRIKLNEQLNQKLEKTAQAIYKQWFVDFEFPMTKEYAESIGKPELEGKAYKANGGEMVWNEELGKDIPVGWAYNQISKIVNTQYGYTASANPDFVGPKFLRITDIAQTSIEWGSVPYCRISDKDLENYFLKKGDVVVARTGATVGYAKMINKKHPSSIFASYLVRITPKEALFTMFIGMSLVSNHFREFIQNVAAGSGQPQASATLMTEFSLVFPSTEVLEWFNNLIEPILDSAEVYQIENSNLIFMKNIVLSKMTKT